MLRRSLSKITLLTILCVLISLIACSQNPRKKKKQVQIKETPQLIKIKTASSQSENGFYNPDNNKLLYFGTITDEENNHVGTVIAVRNLNDSTEQIIDRNVVYPPLGWLDTSRVLIYRTFPKKDWIKNLFNRDYKRAVYIYDLNTNSADTILNLPLRQSDSNIKVDYPYLIYQTGIYNSSRLYKYDLRIRETVALIKDSSEFGLNHMQFAYLALDDKLVYCEFQKRFIHPMKCISNGQETTLFDAVEGTVDITFDKFANRFYYLHYKSMSPEPGQIVGSSYLELKSYDFDTKEIKLHYVFPKNAMINGISPYAKNAVIVSLAILKEIPMKQEVSVGDVRVTIRTAYESHLYILKFND